MSLERLQKVLARAGIASRRHSEEIIAQGRITVDGRVVTEMGVKADPEKQDIRCDGRRLQPEKLVYYLLNKPAGVVCTNADPQSRKRAVELIPGLPAGAHTVGRLDMNTAGLVIVTNDGELTQRVSHARYGVPKTYRAWVRGAMAESTVRGLTAGVMLDGRRCRATRARIVRGTADQTLVELTLVEGRKHEVRDMLERLNHPVDRLERIAIGPIENEQLAPGQWRKLKRYEVQGLMQRQRRPGRKRSTRRRPGGRLKEGRRGKPSRKTGRKSEGSRRHDST